MRNHFDFEIEFVFSAQYGIGIGNTSYVFQTNTVKGILMCRSKKECFWQISLIIVKDLS